MRAAISTLVEYLAELSCDTAAIEWTPPVPAFGDPSRAQVATLGLNPSDREFVDVHGRELDGAQRRFPTLRSLGLQGWHEATDAHFEEIAEACRTYFERNPYDAWFNRLDFLIQETSTSFYTPLSPATHLDLVPYATGMKWATLPRREQELLSEGAREMLGTTLRDAPVSLLILNGMSVVNSFQMLCDVELNRDEQSEWSLFRKTGKNVKGYSFTGVVDRVADIELGGKVLVLGYNHNIQSSFGITKNVCRSIREWIGSNWRAWH